MRHLLRLHTFLQPYIPQMLLALCLLLVMTGLSLVVPGIIQQVIDVGLLQGEVGFMFRSALLILGIGLLRAALTYFQRYATEWVAQRVGYDLRNRLYNHIQQLSFTYHDHSQTGQLISRCIEDVRAIERFAGTGLIDLVRITLLLAGITALLFNANPRLAAIGAALDEATGAAVAIVGDEVAHTVLALLKGLGAQTQTEPFARETDFMKQLQAGDIAGAANTLANQAEGAITGASAMAMARVLVPAPNWSNSKTPTGPFQMMVPALAMMSASCWADSGPMSKIMSSSVTSEGFLRTAGSFSANCLPHTTSTAMGMVALRAVILPIRSLAVSTRSSSHRDLPTG